MQMCTGAIVVSLTMAVIVATTGMTTASAQAKARPTAVEDLETRYGTIV
jgi:hypothetical protein